jgi:hypothetical protein
MNTWTRKVFTIASVPLLAIPSAVGVYEFLEAHGNPIAAGMAAIGFELLYIGVNVLVLSPALQRYARNVALSAVAVAILMNTLAHYGALTVWDWQRATLSLIASAPLAALAYAVSVLLHKLSEEEHTLSLRQRDDSTALATMLRTPTNDSDLTVTESVTLSKSQRVKQLALQRGVSETTIWRQVKQGKVEVE